MSVLRKSAILLALLFCVPLARGGEEFGNFFEAMKSAFDAEKKGEWKEIEWRHSVDEALTAAQKSGKPLMVFIMVREGGKKEATEC